MKIKHWIKAFRLRTLFLSLSCIWAGILCASFSTSINLNIAIFTFVTALFLQILSNLANDYGDSIHGADHDGRKGPSRAVQSGVISKEQMKRALVISASLSFISGCLLLYFAHEVIGTTAVAALFVTGILSIIAAIAYTNGKRPYGYMGLGDISVFLFFGFVAVIGSAYLQTAQLGSDSILLAICFGSLSVGVLNLNNMRDIESDITANKMSIPVRIGLPAAKIYHSALLLLAGICLIQFCLNQQSPQILMILLAALICINMFLALRARDYMSFDPLLKWLSLSTFLITLLMQILL